MHHQIPKSDNTHTQSKKMQLTILTFYLTTAESERKTKTSRLVSEIEMCYLCAAFFFFFFKLNLNLSLIVFFIF